MGQADLPQCQGDGQYQPVTGKRCTVSHQESSLLF
jgi:hypothetical protein